MRRNTGKLGLHVFLIAVILLMGVFVCPVFVSSPALAQNLPPVITIDAPYAGTGQNQGTFVTGINDAGWIAGYYLDSSQSLSTLMGCHAFLRSPDGNFVSFDGPDNPSCPRPTSINASGVVTGTYTTNGNFGCPTPPVQGCGGFEAFVRTPDGNITLFSWPNNPTQNLNPRTTPTAINSAGQIVGYYGDYPASDYPSTGFLRQPDGTFISFSGPNCGGNSTAAHGINGQGVIAGSIGTTDPPPAGCGFRRATDGTLTPVSAANAVFTGVLAINSTSEVAGVFVDTNNATHEFVQAADGTFTTFDIPGACTQGCEIRGLNDRGTVLGNLLTSTQGQVFLRAADGTFTTFTPPGPRGGGATGINSSGAVVGTYVDTNGASHGFLRPGAPVITSFTPNSGPAGTTATLSGASFTGTTAVDFNGAAASFQVISDAQLWTVVPSGATSGPITVTSPLGSATSSTNFSVTSGQPPAMIIFDAPGAYVAGPDTQPAPQGLTGTHAAGINGAGVIAGTFTDQKFAPHGFLRNPDGTFVTFDAPGADVSYLNGTNVVSINSSGAVTGYYLAPGNPDVQHGFLRAPDGTMTMFDVPGAGDAYPTGINDTGAITGSYFDTTATHGFVRASDGTFTTLDFPGAAATLPTSINSSGEIAGRYAYSTGPSRGFLRTPDGTYTTFDPPNAGQGTLVTGISSTGAVVGWYVDSGYAEHGFLRAADGTIATFDVPGADPFHGGSRPQSVNGNGAVVGGYIDQNRSFHAFLRAPDGTFSTFDGPGAGRLGTVAASINDAGAIVGDFGDNNDVSHGFLRPGIGAPVINSFSPTSGPVGTKVTIAGSNFTGTTAVAFNGTPAASFQVISDTQLIVFVPSGATSGPITVTNPAGTSASATAFGVTPHINSFTPTSGTMGSTVTITGTGLSGATRVAFNRVAASFNVDSDAQITATVPAGATTGSLSVTTPWGTGWSFSGSPFTVDSAGMPTITSFSPASGSAGWTVTLTGTNFTGTTGVSFNGTPATIMWGVSDTQFNAKVPSGATSGPITLTNSMGSAVSVSGFTVTPHISSFTPASGTMGTTVTITGASLTGATAVTFFRVPASFTVVSDTQITATVPGGALSGWISVKTGGGTAWSSSNFTPTSAGAPTISSFSPGSGTVGATVTLTGTNFTGTTAVSINGTAATTFWATSDTQLNVKIPSGATSGPITVTNTAGTTSSAISLTVH